MTTKNHKLISIVHYVCRKYATDPDKLGLTKLHKILYYADARNYKLRGASISEASYIKNQFGPFLPALNDALQELESQGKLRKSQREYHGTQKYDLIGIGQPDMSAFSEKEIRAIDNAAEEIAENHTAFSASEKSHQEIWKIAKDYEPLPLYAFLVERLLPLTPADVEWANSEIARLN